MAAVAAPPRRLPRPRLPRMRLPATRERRWTLAGLALVLVAGAVLRSLFFVAWRPALFGWPDAGSYIDMARGELFYNQLRPGGFPLFLRVLHAVSHQLEFTMVANHALGLVSAVLLYLAVARTRVPRALGLVPAAAVALGGDEMFLEHSPLSESLFVLTIAAALYVAVRALERLRWQWVLAAAMLLSLAATVRPVAVPLLGVLGLCVLVRSGVPWRRRLLAICVAGLGTLVVLGGYNLASYEAIGKTGLSRRGSWNLYGRVAPFADCTKFTPPPGTQGLCETRPRAQRPISMNYMFGNAYTSPGVRVFGGPWNSSNAATDKVSAWTRAAILGQPLDYLHETGASLLRYVVPDSFKGVGGGPSYGDLVHDVLLNPWWTYGGRISAAKYYSDVGSFSIDYPMLHTLQGYEAVTRLDGPIFVVLALLSLGAPFTLRGRRRAQALLFTLSAWTLLVVPVMTVEFSGRTAVPGFGPLTAAAAMGGYGAYGAFRRRRAVHRPRRGYSPP